MSDYEELMYKPLGVSDQLYFVGLNYFLSNFSNGKPISKDAIPANTGLTYSCDSGSIYDKINDVVIVFGYDDSFQNPTSKSNITSNSKLDTSNERAGHNIFFNY